MSTEWQGQMGDVLCYGFDPQQDILQALCEQLVSRQLVNTQEVYEKLLSQGYAFPRKDEVLAANNGQLRLPGDNITLLRAHGYASDWHAGIRLIKEAGFKSIKVDMEETVEAVHKSGGVCLISHP